tara:strand:- start:3333 stop:3947 length:615 start_codon:yes stop_codon:yes gene_type:complete
MLVLPPYIGCVYLHGFLSSPDSKKAQELVQYFTQHNMQDQLLIPTLSFEPEEAIQQALTAIQSLQKTPGIKQVFVMGSSLGGFYATYLGQTENLKAILVNPAVRPFELFDKYLGPNEHYYDGQTYILEMKHIEQLQALEISRLAYPEQFLLLQQTGDETLDYRQACTKYINCPSWLEAGGSHSFDGFIDRLDMIFNFVMSESKS